MRSKLTASPRTRQYTVIFEDGVIERSQPIWRRDGGLYAPRYNPRTDAVELAACRVIRPLKG